MSECTLRNKRMVVDGKPYRVWITANYRSESYQLRLRIKADFGAKSSAVIEGLRNVGRFDPYGYWWLDDFNEETETIEVTPGLIAVLIQHALSNGWDPMRVRKEYRVEVSNVEAKAMRAVQNIRLCRQVHAIHAVSSCKLGSNLSQTVAPNCQKPSSTESDRYPKYDG